jgi:hypothetical protein
VAAGEQRGDEVVDDLMLADDPAADLLRQPAPRVGELTQQLDVTRVVAMGSGGWCASCRRGQAGRPLRLVDPGSS